MGLTLPDVPGSTSFRSKQHSIASAGIDEEPPPNYFMESGETENEAQRRRSLRWAEIRRLVGVIRQAPYANRSIERALGSETEVTQSQFVSVMMGEFKFDRKLRMDLHLRVLYQTFDGAPNDKVDCRELLLCEHMLLHHGRIKDQPIKLVLELVDLLAPGARTLPRGDLLRLVAMPAIDQSDVQATAGRLDRCLMEAALPQGLKPTFKTVKVSMFQEILGHYPILIQKLQSLMWGQVPAEWRLKYLSDQEEKQFNKAGYAIEGLKRTRAVAFHNRTIERRYYRCWQGFVKAQQELRIMLIKRNARQMKRSLQTWRIYGSRMRKSYEKRRKAAILGQLSTQWRYFRKLKTHTIQAKKLRTGTFKVGRVGKSILLGTSMFNIAYSRIQLRAALVHWCETANLMASWDFAVAVHCGKTQRKVFRALYDHAIECVAERDRLAEADLRAQAVLASMKQTEKDAKILEEKAAAYQATLKQREKNDMIAKRTEEVLAKKAAALEQGKVRELALLEEQKRLRSLRVQQELEQAQDAHAVQWAINLKEAIDKNTDRTREWLEAAAPAVIAKKELKGVDTNAIDAIQKEVAAIRSRFFAAPSPESKEKERLLSDPANLVFAHIASRLHLKGLTIPEYFAEYDQTNRGYITHQDFKTMVTNLDFKISDHQIREVTVSIDADGSGFIDLAEFQQAMERHESVCGVLGCRWKMYVSPVQMVMLLHNVITNEELYDYKAQQEDLVRVAIDNLVDLEVIRTREQTTKAAEREWMHKRRVRATICMQRMYRRWHGKKEREFVKWSLDLQHIKSLKVRRDMSATMIQCWWRFLRARWLTAALLHLTVERLHDPQSKAEYWFNHTTKTASWREPYLISRFGTRSCFPPYPPLAAWVSIVRSNGTVYYLNTTNGDVESDPPGGYLPCQRCLVQAATRLCEDEYRLLCFVCYRIEHWDTAVSGHPHYWTPYTPLDYQCTVCRQRTCTLVCTECNKAGKKQPKTGGDVGNTTTLSSSLALGNTYKATFSGAQAPLNTSETNVGKLMCDLCWDRVHSGKISHEKTRFTDWMEENSERAVHAYVEKRGEVLKYDEFGMRLVEKEVQQMVPMGWHTKKMQVYSGEDAHIDTPVFGREL